MIQKMTSHELNGILENANNKLEQVITDVKTIKSNINKRLKIMNCEAGYIEQQMEHLATVHKEMLNPAEPGEFRQVFTLFDADLSAKFEKYGCTITPALKTTPTNVFNILATATGEAFFRDIAEVAINGVVKDEYKDILKHDAINNKEIFFEELTDKDPALNISITLDKTKTIGTSLFNMIEFDPFLNGAYTIEYIRIYPQNMEEYEEYANFKSAGKMRILLNKEYNLNKIEFKIVPTYKTQVNGIDKFYAGIKHIYLCNAKFVSDSYAIAKIESNNYIDAIYDSVVIKTPNENLETTAANENIQFYLNMSTNSNGEVVLSSLQKASKIGDVRPISSNVKTIYAKIPIKNMSIIGMTFSITSKIS